VANAGRGRGDGFLDQDPEAYHPECNSLIPLWHYADESKVPAAKSIPVRILS
jgi:hypothetical protein